MHGYDVHEALYQICEIHGPWVRGSGSRVGPIWSYSKNVLNLRKSSSLLLYIFVKNSRHGYDVLVLSGIK